MSKNYIDPDDIGDVNEISYKYLVFRFIGRQRRLQKFEELKVPAPIIKAERNLVQKAYNQMREKCLKDDEYKVHWENIESMSKT
jgi:hypothetical protein